MGIARITLIDAIDKDKHFAKGCDQIHKNIGLESVLAGFKGLNKFLLNFWWTRFLEAVEMDEELLEETGQYGRCSERLGMCMVAVKVSHGSSSL